MVLVGSFEPGAVGLDLRVQLLDSSTGRFRTSASLEDVQGSRVPTCVEQIALAVLQDLGVATPEEGEDVSALSSDPLALDLWARGREAYTLQEWQRAEDCFSSCLKIDPAFTQANYYLARTLWWRGGLYVESSRARAEARLLEAISDADRVSDVDLEKIELLLELVRTGVKPRGPDFGARGAALAKAHPRDRDALELWIECALYARDGTYADLVLACESMLEVEPDFLQAHAELLAAGDSLGSPQLVERAFEEIMRIAPGSQAAMLAHVYRRNRSEAMELARQLAANPEGFYDRRSAILAALSFDEFELAEDWASRGWEGDGGAYSIERIAALAGQGRFADARTLKAATGAVIFDVELGSPPQMGGRLSKLLEAGWLARNLQSDEAQVALEEALAEADETDLQVARFVSWALAEVAWAAGDWESARAHFRLPKSSAR